MATQRMVVTSPWKLGLFVFLLVVGTGFGLVYAWMRLFGGQLQLEDPDWMMDFYYVCGSVAGLGLIGYLSVVANARPTDGVMRGGQQRERILRAFGKIKDPNDADVTKFETIPPLAKSLVRWQEASRLASLAGEGAVHIERSAIEQLVERVGELGSGESLTVREEDEVLAPLVDAINAFASQIREASDAVEGSPTPVASDDYDGARSAWHDSSPEFRQQQAQLLGFAQLLRQSSQSLAQTSNSQGPASAGGIGAGSVERLRELRGKIEGLAEESSRLAIQAALQVSRLGESGGELVQVTEEIREVSTRYQRLVPDLRLCENDAETILSSAGASGANPNLATLMDQSASGIEKIAASMAAATATLSTAFGEAPASRPIEPAAPMGLEPPAPKAFEPARESKASRPAPMSAPVAPVVQPAKEKIHEMRDLGGRELDADGQPIYDLMEFGAAEV